MRSQHLPMTWEAFEALPQKLGWKYEYWDGQAHISPRHHVVVATVAVQPRSAPSSCEIRPVVADDESQLVAAYKAAYSDTIDFCDWEPKKIAAAAANDIRNFFAGKRGAPLPASRVAVDRRPKTKEQRIVGAALLIETAEGPPLLDMLFVLPHWHHKGVATALVSAAVTDLSHAGVERLESHYHLGNEESRTWHQKFGFAEEPDLTLARLYHRQARHELQRRQKSGDLSQQEQTTLIAACQQWEARVEELETISRQLGPEAVYPLLRRR